MKTKIERLITKYEAQIKELQVLIDYYLERESNYPPVVQRCMAERGTLEHVVAELKLLIK